MAISGVENSDSYTTANSRQAASPKSTEDFIKLIVEKRDELLEKIKNGDTEESYQIGSRSFTEKEWDTLLEKFDRIQDEFKRQIREEAAKKEELEEKKQLEKTHDAAPLSPSQTAELIDTLVSNSSTCTYNSENSEESIMYITCYTEDGIFCRKLGAIGDKQDDLWQIQFDSPEQYGKVMNFINSFDSSDNLRFASNESFWQDFLQEKIDVADFMNFYRQTDHGVPDYGIYEGNSVYIDREKAKYANYMNPPGSKWYSEEELLDMLAMQIAQNTSSLTTVSNNISGIFNECAPEVEIAWKQAEASVGVNGFGEETNGKMRYLSQFTIQKVLNQIKGLPSNVFGNTIESAVIFAKKAIDALEHPLEPAYNAQVQQYKLKEKEFYYKFLEFLSE